MCKPDPNYTWNTTPSLVVKLSKPNSSSNVLLVVGRNSAQGSNKSELLSKIHFWKRADVGMQKKKHPCSSNFDSLVQQTFKCWTECTKRDYAVASASIFL